MQDKQDQRSTADTDAARQAAQRIDRIVSSSDNLYVYAYIYMWLFT